MADTDNALTEAAPVSPASSRPRRSRRRKKCLLPVACVTGFILLMNAGISLLLCQWRQPETVSFDMAGTVNSFMAQISGQHLSNEQVKTTTARFNAALNGALTDWQHHHDALILVAPAVVDGAKDITGDIQADVATRMAQAGGH